MTLGKAEHHKNSAKQYRVLIGNRAISSKQRADSRKQKYPAVKQTQGKAKCRYGSLLKLLDWQWRNFLGKRTGASDGARTRDLRRDRPAL
jgi:hypothetical protein